MITVTLRDARESRPDRDWIERAYLEYIRDLSDGQTGVFPALTVTGQASNELLLPWFRDPNAMPLVILGDREPVGFALVEHAAAAAGRAGFRLTDFFVRSESRRRGIGRAAANLIFDRFPGDWTVSEPMRHAGSVAFWRRVIGSYTRGKYRERLSDGDVVHSFSSRPPSA